MFRIVVALAVALIASHALAKNVILRPSPECCNSDSAFQAGSEAVLFAGNKTIGESKLEADSYFAFEDVNAGSYELVVSVTGYYPEKYRGLEIGKDGVFDFELVAALRPIKRTAILEGHIIVWFDKSLPDEAIRERMNKWNLTPLHAVIPGSGSEQPKHTIDRKYDYAEVRARFDRSRDIVGLIWTALQDPQVIACTPVYFSPK